MADFLATQGHIKLRIEDTISHAKEFIYFVTCELSVLPQSVFQKLWHASSKGVKVFIIFGENKVPDADLAVFQTFKNLSIYTNPSIRFNTTFNEHEAVTHSLCITSNAEPGDIHSGIHFKKKYASVMYEHLLEEVKKVRNNGTKMTLHQGQLHDYLKIQTDLIKAEEERKPIPQTPEAVIYGSKKLTAKERQKLIVDTFGSQCPDCSIKVEDAERIRIQGKGLVVFTNKEKSEVIFVRYDSFNARKDEFKEHILRKHPGLKIWCTYNRITLHVDKAEEVVSVFISIKDALQFFGLA